MEFYQGGTLGIMKFPGHGRCAWVPAASRQQEARVRAERDAYVPTVYHVVVPSVISGVRKGLPEEYLSSGPVIPLIPFHC